jgi:hypothetical protein
MLLISTYELGHQPLHVASPAGALIRAGHDVRCLDLSVEPFDAEAVRWADAAACSVPMHTACRLALAACAQIHTVDPEMPLCLYGLYAHLASASAEDPLVNLTVAGEYEPRIVQWADEFDGELVEKSARVPDHGSQRLVELGRGHFGLPARHMLPPLDRYARLAAFGEQRLAGYVEASHGCAHRCRHCPVPVVYDGRTRLVSIDALVEDISQLAEMGARHVTFGDPDFLNGPRHALRVLSALHGSFPELTFDVTAKVEHVLAHPELWPRFAQTGCLFVVSAFESTNDTILAHLAKGHRAAEEVEAVAVLRAAGIEPRPSLLPFTPWTSAQDVIDLLDLVAACDLIGNVDPVQYAIRLLVPPGSLLLASGSLDGHLGPYDAGRLGWTWNSPDPRLDRLALELSRIAERAGAENWSSLPAYEAIRAETVTSLGLDASAGPPSSAPRLRSTVPPDERPRLTEAWFCCAEPTEAQLRGAVLEAPSALPVP